MTLCTDFSAGRLVINSMITWSLYMLNMGNISNPIRIVPLRESQGEYTGGMVNLPLPAVSFVTGTSEDACSPVEVQHVPIPDMFRYQLLANATGAELPECSKLLRIVVYEVASDIVLTSYQTVRLLPYEAPKLRLIPHSNQEVPADVYSRPIQARRLREISGL